MEPHSEYGPEGSKRTGANEPLPFSPNASVITIGFDNLYDNNVDAMHIKYSSIHIQILVLYRAILTSS